jgi:hypothetical protein
MTRSKLCSDSPDGGGWAMPLRGRSGAVPSEPLYGVSGLRPPAAIAGPSKDFVSLTRNPDLEPPARFEPTPKQPGDVVL